MDNKRKTIALRGRKSHNYTLNCNNEMCMEFSVHTMERDTQPHKGGDCWRKGKKYFPLYPPRLSVKDPANLMKSRLTSER